MFLETSAKTALNVEEAFINTGEAGSGLRPACCQTHEPTSMSQVLTHRYASCAGLLVARAIHAKIASGAFDVSNESYGIKASASCLALVPPVWRASGELSSCAAEWVAKPHRAAREPICCTQSASWVLPLH